MCTLQPRDNSEDRARPTVHRDDVDSDVSTSGKVIASVIARADDNAATDKTWKASPLPRLDGDMDIPGRPLSKAPGLSGIFITLSGWPLAAGTSAATVGLDVVVVVDTVVMVILAMLFAFGFPAGFAPPPALLAPPLFALALTPLFPVALALLLTLLALPLLAALLQLLTAATLTTPSLAISWIALAALEPTPAGWRIVYCLEESGLVTEGRPPVGLLLGDTEFEVTSCVVT